MTGPGGGWGRDVVVGVDASPAAANAVVVAASLAQERGVRLTLLHTWGLPAARYQSAHRQSRAIAEQTGAAVLREAAEGVERTCPGLAHREVLSPGSAAAALVAAAESAELVVVGRHQGSTAWLGAVPRHLAAEARCPVVVVPDDADLHHDGIVVGVDGSQASDAAVAWAFGQASRWGCRLTAVLCLPPTLEADVVTLDLAEVDRDRGRRYLAEALAGYGDTYLDVPVAERVALQSPLPALLEAAQGAALLVVGSHGRGAVLRTVLGSVSCSLLRAAPCPVAVVRRRRPVDPSSRHRDAADRWAPIPVAGLL